MQLHLAILRYMHSWRWNILAYAYFKPIIPVINVIKHFCYTYIHTYIHKLYLSSDFSVAYIASISDPN